MVWKLDKYWWLHVSHPDIILHRWRNNWAERRLFSDYTPHSIFWVSSYLSVQIHVFYTKVNLNHRILVMCFDARYFNWYIMFLSVGSGNSSADLHGPPSSYWSSDDGLCGSVWNQAWSRLSDNHRQHCIKGEQSEPTTRKLCIFTDEGLVQKPCPIAPSSVSIKVEDYVMDKNLE